MVFYLTEDILREAVDGNTVADAVSKRQGVVISYSGDRNGHTGDRYIEPYVYGLSTAGNPCIRAYQYYGDTKTGVPKWKLFRLDRITSWKPTENHFEIEPKARGWAAQSFNGQDRSMQEVYAVAGLGEEPMTDIERMRARTRQIQQQKPLNIKDFSSQKQEGPVGGNKPETGTTPPVQQEKPTQSKPLNTDGSEKNMENVPPVRQEPKTSGPITGDARNPEQNKADELMSNDEFRQMLQRNLNITDKEKQNRGFNLQNQI